MSSFSGCYYYVASAHSQKQYLSLLNSEAHTTILSTTSTTTLKQTFTNPSSTDAIKQCTYNFPLYDGVSVVCFTCRIGKKVLTGLVKDNAKAKEIFDQAVAKGETAGLFQQAPEASDIFSTKLGNIPAGESVIVEVTYVGELKYHETEGIRFTIPTKIAPRYGSGPSHGFSCPEPFYASGDSRVIKIVVDINMPEGSRIKSVQSPSHPIAVSMGTVSTSTNDDPTMSKASATLSLGSAALEKDFVLIVQSKDVGIPKAILETHPTIPNQRALMATLVPKFSLPPSRCEIVFVADRSGSMENNIEMLVSAMKVFLKSLPPSIMFNICSFGSYHSFLWEKSQSSSRESIKEAVSHLNTFSANMGGTETFGAIRGTVERRMSDIPLEIILLTDGDIYQQNDLFEYVNQQVEATKGKVRVFPLGIGEGVSHSLIEGLARAGNGFAQAVQIGERLDDSVVRMLRGALSPHITDYTLEVKYEAEISDDYELLDRVTDSMKVLLTDDTRSLKSASSSASPTPKPTISLFDANLEPEIDIQEMTVVLPSISSPKLLQAPTKIPTLFAFSRTTVYLLMSPETIQRKPIAVILRGTSEHGPLALEIPVEVMISPAKTVHQLAAKKAVQDLEEGRGWLLDAKDKDGALLKDKYPSCFDDFVKREAVRLGEKFQIAGKYCSFVAVSSNDKEMEEKKRKAAAAKIIQHGSAESDISASEQDAQCESEESEWENVENVPAPFASSDVFYQRRGSTATTPPPPPYQHQSSLFGSVMSAGGSNTAPPPGLAAPLAPQTQGISSTSLRSGAPVTDRDTFSVESRRTYAPVSYQRSASPPIPRPQSISPQQQQQQQQQISRMQSQMQSQQASVVLSRNTRSSLQSGQLNETVDQNVASLHGEFPPAAAPYHAPMVIYRRVGGDDDVEDPAPMKRGVGSRARASFTQSVATTNSANSAPASLSSGMKSFQRRDNRPSRAYKKTAVDEGEGDMMDLEEGLAVIDWTTKSTADKVLALIDLQDFDGWWPVTFKEVEIISKIVGVNIEEMKDENEAKTFITLLVVKFLEEKCQDEEGTWGLVVEKARAWLEGLGKELKGIKERVGKLLA